MNKMKNTWKNTTIRLWMAVALVLSVIAGNMEHTVAVEGKTLSTAVFAYLDVGQGNAELIRTNFQRRKHRGLHHAAYVVRLKWNRLTEWVK